MDTEHELAFLRGMRKRALEKEAFVGPLVGGVFRALAPFAATLGVQHKVIPKLMTRPGMVGKGATMMNNALNSKKWGGLGGMAAQMGLHSAMSPVVDPAVGYVADKFDGQGY